MIDHVCLEAAGVAYLEPLVPLHSFSQLGASPRTTCFKLQRVFVLRMQAMQHQSVKIGPYSFRDLSRARDAFGFSNVQKS